MDTKPVVRNIDLDDIEIADENIRKNPDEDLDELIESIKKFGVLQPIVVYPIGKKEYRVVIGRRRFLACAKISKHVNNQIPARIISTPKSLGEGLAMSAIENIQRKNLTASERSNAIAALLLQYGTPKNVAKATGLSEYTVVRWLKYKDIVPPEIKEIVDAGKLTKDEALGLVSANYPDMDRAIELAQKLASTRSTKFQKQRVIRKSRKDKKSSATKLVEDSKTGKELKVNFYLVDQYVTGLRKASKNISAEQDHNEAAQSIVEEYLEDKDFV